MSSVAQILTSRAAHQPVPRILLGTVYALEQRKVGVILDPGGAKTTVLLPLDIPALIGDRVVVMIHPTARIVLARLENAA